MRTRTRNVLWLVALAACVVAVLAFAWRFRRRPDLAPRALDAIPRGALLVAIADVAEMRLSPVGRRLLDRVRERRVIAGLGTVREVCGFDPLDAVDEIALAVPASGREGEFGIAAAGRIEADALVACAAKVTEARGGKAVVAPVGGFRTVREADLEASGEISVRPGMVLLGGGTYLRAMMDSAEGRMPTIRSSGGHGELVRSVGDATIRASVVLTPELLKTLQAELAAAGAPGAPAARMVAGAIGIHIAETASLHVVLACGAPEDAPGLAAALAAARDEQASDPGIRLMGVGDVLSRVAIEHAGLFVHARVDLPADQALALADRVLALGSLRGR